MRATATTIEVFFNNTRVASHQRSYSAGRHTTEPRTCPTRTGATSSGRPSASWPGRTKNGPSTGTFIEALMKSRPHPEQGYRSALGVMRLEKKYGAARLDDAVREALALRSF